MTSHRKNIGLVTLAGALLIMGWAMAEKPADINDETTLCIAAVTELSGHKPTAAAIKLCRHGRSHAALQAIGF